MLRSSLDAMSMLLTNACPDVTQIYVFNLPDQPVQPSFLMQLYSSTNEDLSYKNYSSQTVWQITYYSTQDANSKGLDLVDRFDQVRVKIMADRLITGPDGTQFHILGVETVLRETDVVLRITLQTEYERASKQYEDVKHVSIHK
ncbi:hypothetical protein NV379_23360 [Paenibacillus sp. N1-5-1-14]|uniref:phage tail terminator family protein n=1 Tax=Paenibacillus radicibacter TaxID=2972488 RepID=UPI0021590FB5|nr:hypothetical protein [Paenibacillus radicibacter]MCR8645581.1 hypothetical protein [Paenibacillus radicibacter]